MSTSPIGSTTSTNGTNSNGTTAGINSLSSTDFMKLMLTQLEQQDPLNPTDSNQMLSQLSQISNLQSNSAMQTSLSGLTLQQSIGAGGNLMGKSITGLSTVGSNVTGNVSSVQVIDQNVYLGLDNGSTVAMSNVTNIAAGVLPTSANGTVTSPTTLSGAATSALDSFLSSLIG